METYDTNRIITCQLILREVLADVESSAKPSIELAIAHLENVIARPVVMQQCINCGKVENSRYSCSRCGSTDLHLFEATEVK